MRSVLESVYILLSDPFSNFVCLIAVDSQIACSAIESTMTSETSVIGHEVLKKIINLPFYLPEVGKKVETEFFGFVTSWITAVARLKQD